MNFYASLPQREQGIYGDLLYGLFDPGTSGAEKTGMLLYRAAGPTIGPLLELGVTNPLDAVQRALEGKETHLLAQTVGDVKGFVPAQNIWYLKAAIEHLVWHNVMESVSPGYLARIRERTQRQTGQQWWWAPGELTPERAPDLEKAIER